MQTNTAMHNSSHTNQHVDQYDNQYSKTTGVYDSYINKIKTNERQAIFINNKQNSHSYSITSTNDVLHFTVNQYLGRNVYEVAKCEISFDELGFDSHENHVASMSKLFNTIARNNQVRRAIIDLVGSRLATCYYPDDAARPLSTDGQIWFATKNFEAFFDFIKETYDKNELAQKLDSRLDENDKNNKVVEIAQFWRKATANLGSKGFKIG